MEEIKGRYGEYEEKEFISEYYDAVYDQLRSKDIDFWVDYAVNSLGRTLELGCGTGRVLIPTAVAGCEITGLDLSPYMLDKCREKLEKHPDEVRRRVRLVESNMTGFDTGETYSLITIPFRPFQHFITVEEQKACLNCVHSHLEMQGLLVFDVFNPFPPRLIYNAKYAEEQEDLPEKEMPDGRKLRRTVQTTGTHRDRQYNDFKLTYHVTHPDGKEEKLVQYFSLRYYYRFELEHLLELCGFTVVDFFGDYDKSPFTEDSPEMIFVAGKK